MAQLLTFQYEKNNATFASGEEAFADKNSFFSSEYTQSTIDSDNLALANGILLEPKYFEWDQDLFLLTVCRLVTSAEEYLTTRTYNTSEDPVLAAEAGWVFMGHVVQDEE
jgi:hypothetical protein